MRISNNVSRESSNYSRSDYRQSSPVLRNGSFDAAGISQTLAQRVISSVPYQNALQLFQKASDSVWLQRLLSIPYSVDDAQSSFLDDIGLSNNYEDKQDALYADCMTKIEQLVADYQSYVNSLPTTQVQQLNDAGINSAITGQGVSGSTLSPNVVSPNGISMQSSNVGEFLNNTANFLLSATGGFADIALKFKDLGLRDARQSFDIDLAKKNFVKDVLTYAREHGMIFANADYDYDSIRNVQFKDSEGNAIRFEKAFQSILSQDKYSPLIARDFYTSETSGPHTALTNSHFGDDGQLKFITVGGHSYARSIAVDKVVDAQYQLYRLSSIRRLLNEKYQSQISQYGVDSAEYDSIVKNHQSNTSSLDEKEKSIRFDLIKSLHESGNEMDKLLLMKILTTYNEDDIDILNANADMVELERSLGVAGQVLNILD